MGWQPEIQTISDHPVDSKADSLDVKEPKEEKKDQQEEVVDSWQKKTKNKKNANKKKKSPAPVETHQDVKEELICQDTKPNEVSKEQVKSGSTKWGEWISKTGNCGRKQLKYWMSRKILKSRWTKTSPRW